MPLETDVMNKRVDADLLAYRTQLEMRANALARELALVEVELERVYDLVA